MDLSPKSKSVLIAAAVCSLAMASILSMIPIVKPAYGVTWCQNQKGKDDNWKSGCESGAADCRGGKPYHPGSGHTRDFHLGYDAGWNHAGCS